MKRVLVFFGALFVCASIMWLGGFNFDQRNTWVAWSSVLALAVSGWAASFPWEK
jgi:drug/metabolite transporter superfamily protein YnfA